MKFFHANYFASLVLITIAGLLGCQPHPADPAIAAAPFMAKAEESADSPRTLGSGLDFGGFDTDVRPQDDLFGYVNGKWVATTEIPGDLARWGTFDVLHEASEKDIRTLVEEVSAQTGVEHGSPTQKIRDYFNAYMAMEAAGELAIDAIRSELDEISKISSLDELFRAFSSLGVYGVNSPVGLWIDADMKDPNAYGVYIDQAGTTLPDRDYYLLDDQPYVDGRRLFLEYATAILAKSGFDNPAQRADRLLELETRIAEVQWTKEDNRDWSKRYNPKNLDELAEMAPGINWAEMLDALGIGGRDRYIALNPSFFTAVSDIINDTPLATWRDYLAFHTISTFAPVLSEEYFMLGFNFFDKGLSGTEQPRELWKRAVTSINNNMGELLGQLYVARHFQDESKVRMDQLIQNLLKAYRVSIAELEWMSDETRAQALDKLAKFKPMIGYPDEWRDYSKLEIVAGDLIGNIKRSAEFEVNRQIGRLDEPVDKSEWHMTPQTVNAYYHPILNVIVFPASILQPPFFNVDADDAVNYGAIGAGIGHEIGHGFDDSGSRFDGDGVLRDWWTDEDREKFEQRKDALAAQYDGYEVIDGMTINGQFTSGENIGDLGGLAIAYEAYKMSLDGKEAPVIDGLTGDQRFFLGWAQVWRTKSRDEEIKRRLTADPHSPARFRANGAAVNVDAFYTAFGVQEGDGMYLPPEQRVKIW